MIRIPTPPSLNNIFFNRKGGGRAKTADYKAWLTTAGYHLLAQRPQKFSGDVIVNIQIGPRIPNSDIDNRIKATLDLLTKMRIIKNDRYVVNVQAAWNDNLRGCEVVVSAA